MTQEELEKAMKKAEKDMKKAATELLFERAAELRDMLMQLKKIYISR